MSDIHDHIHQHSSEIVEMTQRLFRLRKRFRVEMPENIATLKKRINESNLQGKTGGVIDFDTFYNIGIIFSRHAGSITMGELSHDLGIPLSSATRTMDWYVRNEYARRSSDPQDRRVVRVELTEAGKEIYHTIHERFMENIERIMGSLSAEERITFNSLLRKVLDAFENENEN